MDHAEGSDQIGTRAGTTETDALTAFLANRDFPCPRCGYNLRDLRADRCPECGDALRLQVGLVDPRYGPYVAAVAGVCLGGGASGLLSVIALMKAGRGWWSKPGARAMLVLLGSSVALAVLLVALRRSFRRRDATAQRWVAISVWAFVLLLATLVVAWFDG